MSQPSDEFVRVCEVGPRDGLQNEPALLELADKIDFVNGLSACGFPEIEVGSFVRPDRVPQLADTLEVFKGIDRRPGITYSALVPNLRGLDRALEAGVDKIAVFTSASEGFAEANIGCSIQRSLELFGEVMAGAAREGLPVRGYVSCVISCPYDGPTPVEDVRSVCERLAELGVDELDLGDTIGTATPESVTRLYEGLGPDLKPSRTVLHLHDTNRKALSCAGRALDLGVRSFDAACGGLGGCPYAPGASGNLATEALAGLIEERGFTSGLDRVAILDLGQRMRRLLGPGVEGDTEPPTSPA